MSIISLIGRPGCEKEIKRVTEKLHNAFVLKNIDVTLLDYETIERTGIGEVLQREIGIANENKINHESEKDYYTYVEVMLRSAQTYFDQEIILSPLLRNHNLVLMNGGFEKTFAYLTNIFKNSQSKKDAEEFYEWLDLILGYFARWSDLSIYVDNPIDLNGNSSLFKYISKHSNLEIVDAIDEKSQDLKIEKIVNNYLLA